MHKSKYPPINLMLEDGTTINLEGRNAWALRELVSAGVHGCTPIDTPGPRWSAYVFNLRKAGLEIETVQEIHDGEFPGTQARYVLRSSINIVEKALL